MFSAARWQLFWSRWHASVHWAASHKTKRYARLSGNYTPLSSSKNSSQEVNERTRGTAPLYTSSPQNRIIVCLPLRRQKLSSTPQSLISTKTPRTVSWIIPFDAEPVAATKFSPEKTYIYVYFPYFSQTAIFCSLWVRILYVPECLSNTVAHSS